MARTPKAETHAEPKCDPPPPPPPCPPDDPPPTPDPHSGGTERLLWDVLNASYASVVMTDAELAAALAAGTYQDLGDVFLVDGLGQPAPPLALALTVGEVNYLEVTVAITGGPAAQGSVTVYFGDRTYARHDGANPAELVNAYPEPGLYQISAINNYGQQAYKYVTVGVENPALANA